MVFQHQDPITIDTYIEYLPKYNQNFCGDLIAVVNHLYHSTVIHVDGKGSGVKAHVIAQMVVSRIKRLLAEKLSLEEVHKRVTKTMLESIAKDLPFCAFQMIRIFRDGKVRVMGFEMPPPLIFSGGHCYPLVGENIPSRHLESFKGTFQLKPDEYIISISDGIKQAGLGMKYADGWGIDRLAAYTEFKVNDACPSPSTFSLLIQKATRLWNGKNRDDCSLIAIRAKRAHVVNIFTGPPSNKSKDFLFLRNIEECNGEKIICGGTTAKLVSNHQKIPLKLEEEINLFGLPRYSIQGFDLVTEGSITLNMVNNLVENSSAERMELTPAVALYEKLLEADIVHFHVGLAENSSLNQIEFKQLAISSRKYIIPELAQKLEEKGKIVTITWY